MTQQRSDHYALVTGASRGLGKAIAIELARQGYPTILVSRSDKVYEVCKEITSQYGIPSVGFTADLTDPCAIAKLAEQVDATYQVFMLVNNAGVGGSRRFAEASTQYLENILDLNAKGTALLTHALLPNLLRQPQAYVLNIGSMAAHTPTGFKTVYPASKAFIHHFSLGLREELKDTPVSVSVCSPGAMATNDEVTARIERQGFFGRFTLKSVESIARKCVRQTLRRKRHIVINPISYALSSMVPNVIKTPILTRIVKREL